MYVMHETLTAKCSEQLLSDSGVIDQITKLIVTQNHETFKHNWNYPTQVILFQTMNIQRVISSQSRHN